MTNSRTRALVAVALIVFGLAGYGAWRLKAGSTPELGATTSASAEQSAAPNAPARDRNSVDLSDSQLASVKVEAVEAHEFPIEKEAIGSIDFDEDMAVQVFTPYQGRIIALYASVGDDVKKGPDPLHYRQPRSVAGGIHADRRRRRAGIDDAQSDAPARAV